MKQKAGTIHYFRHFVSDFNSDLSLAITTLSGTPYVYVAIDPSKKWPNNGTSDYYSIEGTQSGTGSTFTFTPTLLSLANPSCADKQLGTTEPCAIYVGVTCDVDCVYSLKVSYDNSVPSLVVLGQH
jgi:hypothetical protein